jgi:DNA polymerase-3 subunit delta'
MTSATYLVETAIKHIALKPHPDNLSIGEDGNYEIATVRESINWIHQKPFNRDYKILLIYRVEKLSIEAQNTLLKTLEEPPANNLILLTSFNSQKVLPTVLSRCIKITWQGLQMGKLIHQPDNADWVNNLEITDIKHDFSFTSIETEKDAFAEAEKLAKMDRDELQTYLDEWVNELMEKNPRANYILADAILTAKEQLANNTNIQLTLEVAFLKKFQEK